MRNDGNGGAVVSAGQKQQHGKVNNGFFPTSVKALSGYLRIVSSGASTVASTVRSAASAASAIVERESESNQDQVYWAGFDELECDGGIARKVLLLGYQYGFQVWDVEETHNVHNVVSRHDGPVSFMKILPKPDVAKLSIDKYSDSRPLLTICADGSFSGGINIYGGSANLYSGNIQHNPESGHFVPNVVWFYSLRSKTYVHQLKFRSVVLLVRCSSRVVAILQENQVHCFDSATLERQYTILTNPVVTGVPGSGGLGMGPLAVGPRWMAYSGCPVAVSNSSRVSPQHLTPSSSFPGPASNGSLVAHYAKESSKQLAAGIVTLGDMGYKKLSRYCSELLPDGHNSQSGSARVRVQGNTNGQSLDADNVGMVIVRDTVSKTVVSQFRAHSSPISSLCFDPSGTLLVTASVMGHNINVFRIMPGFSSNSSGAGSSYVHLYRLQRGFTNAVIQDISFSSDSQWVLVSSSRGTSHLFAISPFGGPVGLQFSDASYGERSGGSSMMAKSASRGPSNSNIQVLSQQSIYASGPPVTLSVVHRIRSGSSGWRNTVSGAAAVATGKINSVSGAIASTFRCCKGNDVSANTSYLKSNYYLLLFSPSGCLVQYAMRENSNLDSGTTFSGVDTSYESDLDNDPRIFVEAIQKWNICQKHSHKEREDNLDIYGENGYSDRNKVFPEADGRENVGYSAARSTSTLERLSLEERHHLYISEAELQTRQSPVPLWGKREISFHSAVADGFNMDGEGGELEIEKVPTRIIEVRSKDLVPVYDYLQAPMFHQGRSAGLNSNNNESPGSQGPLESLDSSTNDGMLAAELYDGTGKSALDGLQMPTKSTEGFVDNNDSPKVNTQDEIVYNRDNSMTGNQLKLVNTDIDGLIMENQIVYRGDQFD